MIKLSVYTSYGKMKKPIYFQGQAINSIMVTLFYENQDSYQGSFMLFL